MTTVLDSSNSYLLHGANGVDFGEVVVVFSNQVVIVKPKNEAYHLTIYLGTESKALEIHRTLEPGPSNSPGPLFSISHAGLRKMLEEIATPANRTLLDILRPIRVGWMARNKLGVLVDLILPESELPLVMTVRRGKVVVDMEKVDARAWSPYFLDDLYKLPDGRFFTVFSFKDPTSPKQIGLGFKFTDPAGRPQLRWLKNRRVAEAARRIGEIVRNAAAKYGTFHTPLPWS